MASVLTSAARVSRRLGVLAGVIALALVAAGPVAGQDGLRIKYDRDQSDPNQFVLSGRVFNDTRRDALDVSVTAEALDTAKKVVASGVSYVAAALPAGTSAPFTMKVPRVPNASTFRVMATGYRFGLSSQSP